MQAVDLKVVCIPGEVFLSTFIRIPCVLAFWNSVEKQEEIGIQEDICLFSKRVS
jgi:hypothetical protein